MMFNVFLAGRLRICCGSAVMLLALCGCAPQGLFYWGDYESSLYERYVENNGQQTDAYLRNTITAAEQHQQRVPPGVFADYGFLLFTRGEKANAIAYFQKERALYPESTALMNKLIEKIQQQEKPPETKSEPTVTPVQQEAAP
jgi:hypothetical protein